MTASVAKYVFRRNQIFHPQNDNVWQNYSLVGEMDCVQAICWKRIWIVTAVIWPWHWNCSSIGRTGIHHACDWRCLDYGFWIQACSRSCSCTYCSTTPRNSNPLVQFGSVKRLWETLKPLRKTHCYPEGLSSWGCDWREEHRTIQNTHTGCGGGEGYPFSHNQAHFL